jgi:hypothetical protein
MNVLLPSLSALAVSAIYCAWAAYHQDQLRRQRLALRERVAYMLWVMAHQAE